MGIQCEASVEHATINGLGIGFTAYDIYTSYLRDAEGKISGPATVLAGLGTGVTESVLAVTPFESIKTQM